MEEPLDERLRLHYDLGPIDGQSSAVRGCIAVDGKAILAEFATQDDARSALAQLSQAEENRSALRPRV